MLPEEHMASWRREWRNGFPCTVCKRNFTSKKDFVHHKSTQEHTFSYLKFWLSRNLADLQTDKHGITVTSPENPECVPKLNIKLEPGKVETFILRISASQNEDLTANVEFCDCILLHKMPCITLYDEHRVTEGKAVVALQKGDCYDIKVTVTAKEFGHFILHVVFQFVKEGGSTPFFIVRTFEFSCGNLTLWALEPHKPYDPKEHWRWWQKEPATHIVPGNKPIRDATELRLETVLELKDYLVPDHLRNILQTCCLGNFHPEPQMETEHKLELERVCQVLQAGLTMENYKDYFQLLLHFEEAQNDVDIRNYDLENVTMNHVPGRRQLLALEVPGLAENRPSVLRGDRVYVRIRHKDVLDKVEYEGFVHEILNVQVHLGFHRDLLSKFIKGMRFDVRFIVSRYPFRLMHRAMAFSERLQMTSLLFPTHATAAVRCPLFTMTDPINLYNQAIASNPEQESAVKHILAGISRPAPYILFGPPGTGKTVTMVEAIKQVWNKLPKSFILVSAPSNSAADLVTLRLLEHIRGEKNILRIYATSYGALKIPAEIKKHCNNRGDGQYFYPSKKELMGFRIVVTTLVTAGRLVSANLPLGHFTHIFIDEAGHSLEPECMIPVAGLLKVDGASESPVGGQLVLAGDPKQLGPILRSILANKGLGMSLLERYTSACEVYQRLDGQSCYDVRVLTKLLNNYRSHSEILKLPNELFYDGELKVCAGPERNIFAQWSMLPKPGFPMLFHGVLGRDLREASSPSYFNPEEVLTVLNYVDNLLSAQGLGMRIQAKDIGIISPYRRQVEKIRQHLRNPSKAGISVGSVEEFQGQERQVIIISTVRSSAELLAVDSQHHLGFLKNPKRFNVAITRAKALLIIVGNPYLLSQDTYWNKLLQFCMQNGSYVGARYDGPDLIDDVISKLQSLSLADSTDQERLDTTKVKILISQKTLQEEPQWRGEE